MTLPASPAVPARGVYLITPDEADTARLLTRAAPLLVAGPTWLQYRNKTASDALRRKQAQALQDLCAAHGVPLIINDDPALALEVGAAGVHLGGTDGDLKAARKKLGRGKLLGASCYDSIELAYAAREAGADHVAFGAVYASGTKPGAVRAPLDLFRQARPLGLPVVAIGGITAENAAPVIEAGASAVAVVSDIFEAPDIRARARQYAALFNT